MSADFEIKRVGSAFAKDHLHDLAQIVADENLVVMVERYGKPCVVMLGPAHLDDLLALQEQKELRGEPGSCADQR